MSNVSEPADAGQITEPATPTDEKRTVMLLEAISAHLTALDERFDVIEKHLEGLDRDVLRAVGTDARAGEEEPVTEAIPEPLPPSYALRCDGRVLLSTRDLEGIDLSGRETFTGIVLSEAEASDALDRMANAFEEAAAHSAGWLRKKVDKGGGGNEP
jgi:hypothetical protein